jgi:hypothetical protein
MSKKPSAGRKYFENHWLPNCEQPIAVSEGAKPAGPVEREPDGWKDHLKEKYPDESWAVSAMVYTWESMPAPWRSKIAREIAARDAARPGRGATSRPPGEAAKLFGYEY